MIDRATIDKIMDAANIVDVVGEFVSLRKAGVNFKGLCPFHDDKTPSFMVSPSKQICHCFACGEGGNAVNFLMKHEQITYPEALRWLAKKYNIEVAERELSDEEKKEQSDRESMFIVNEWACQYFHDILNNDVDGQAIGKQYFRSRGIRDDIIKKFQLGFALAKRDALANEGRRKGYQEEFLTKTGLCIKNERGIYDRFSGRVIFPWLNISGKVVAFGGRKLDAATKGVQQKYTNSPDSEIYHKEHELYGLYQAKQAIAKEKRAYMVEGYTDVIAMHQCGLENVVANSGTALSAYQVRLLHRFTQDVTLLYDGDDAGIHAALRGIDMMLKDGMKVKVLVLPDGDDPDSFSRKHTATEFRQYIEDHQVDFTQFKIDLLLKGVKDPGKRAEAIKSIIRSVSFIPDPVERSIYLTDCARRLEEDERTLVSQMNKYIAGDREEQRKEAERTERLQEQTTTPEPIGLHTPQEQTSEVERMLIQLIIRHGNVVIMKDLETEDGGLIDLNVAQYVDFEFSGDGLSFSSDLYNRILQEAVGHSADPEFKAETYFTQHPDVEISQLATHLAIDNYQLGKGFAIEQTERSLRQQAEHLILDFRYIIVSARLKEINRELKMKPEGERLKELMQEFMDTNNLYQQLGRQLGR